MLGICVAYEKIDTLEVLRYHIVYCWITVSFSKITSDKDYVPAFPPAPPTPTTTIFGVRCDACLGSICCCQYGVAGFPGSYDSLGYFMYSTNIVELIGHTFSTTSSEAVDTNLILLLAIVRPCSRVEWRIKLRSMLSNKKQKNVRFERLEFHQEG